MNQFKKKMYDLSGPKTVEALNKRRFEAYYCSTAEEAVEKALELIPREDTVSWGGAMTVDELGLKQRLAQEGYTLLDRDTAKTPEEKQAIMRQALTCGTFLMSSNAISKDGQLVNIDGMGNRVAAMCFGPRQVVVIAGMNKVLGTLDDAVARARNVAAPANAQRGGRLVHKRLVGMDEAARDLRHAPVEPRARAAVQAIAVRVYPVEQVRGVERALLAQHMGGAPGIALRQRLRQALGLHGHVFALEAQVIFRRAQPLVHRQMSLAQQAVHVVARLLH